MIHRNTSRMHNRRQRGILVMDTVAGIVLAIALLMLMTVAVIKQSRREQELADIRTAARAAESAMLLLQAGQPIPADIHAETLPAEKIGSASWIRITAAYKGHTAGLVGLIDNPSPGATP